MPKHAPGMATLPAIRFASDLVISNCVSKNFGKNIMKPDAIANSMHEPSDVII